MLRKYSLSLDSSTSTSTSTSTTSTTTTPSPSIVSKITTKCKDFFAFCKKCTSIECINSETSSFTLTEKEQKKIGLPNTTKILFCIPEYANNSKRTKTKPNEIKNSKLLAQKLDEAYNKNTSTKRTNEKYIATLQQELKLCKDESCKNEIQNLIKDSSRQQDNIVSMSQILKKKHNLYKNMADAFYYSLEQNKVFLKAYEDTTYSFIKVKKTIK